MQFKSTVIYVFALIGVGLSSAWLTGLWRAQTGDNVSFSSKTTAYDAGRLLALEPFGQFDADQHFSRDLALVFYFDELSCETCKVRELQTLAAWHERYGHQVDFLLVVHGQNPIYLHNLIRVGKVRYPILLETNQGDSGLGQTSISLLDKMNGRVIGRYFPTPEPDDDPEVTAWLERLLKRTLAQSRQGA